MTPGLITNYLRRILPTRLTYRGWQLTVTNAGAVGRKLKSSEYFIIGRLTSFEQATRLAKGKVERLEGPEVWDMDYEDGALL